MSQTKKQIPLRISSQLYDQLASWAQDEFRSLNGQIEYLLSEALRKRGRLRPAELSAEDEQGDPPTAD